MTSALYIGGTGEISHACVHAAAAAGQQVAVFNRGRRDEPLPESVEQIIGDLSDEEAYAALAERGFDVVCQYLAFGLPRVERDIAIFGGKVKQYIFISSASAYQKPCRDHLITEDTPLENPFWEYSRKKAAMERRLLDAHAAGDLPVTIVRPSHTHRMRFPGTFISGDHLAWRMRRGKPIIVHGDGQSLWTVTHADDYAAAFIKLCGNDRALGEAYHITRDRGHTWDVIVAAMGRVLGVEPKTVHVASDVLVRYNPDWAGPLHGDKTNSVVFDNTKVRDAVGGWRCEIPLEEGLRRAGEHVKRRLDDGWSPDPDTDALIDRIITDHEALGA